MRHLASTSTTQNPAIQPPARVTAATIAAAEEVARRHGVPCETLAGHVATGTPGSGGEGAGVARYAQALHDALFCAAGVQFDAAQQHRRAARLREARQCASAASALLSAARSLR